jgi:hypothetical protein
MCQLGFGSNLLKKTAKMVKNANTTADTLSEKDVKYKALKPQ